ALLVAGFATAVAQPGSTGGGTGGGGSSPTHIGGGETVRIQNFDLIVGINVDDFTLPRENISGTKVNVSASAVAAADPEAPPSNANWVATRVKIIADGTEIANSTAPVTNPSWASGRVSSLHWAHGSTFTVKAIGYFRDLNSPNTAEFPIECYLDPVGEPLAAVKVYNVVGGIDSVALVSDNPATAYPEWPQNIGGVNVDPQLYTKDFDVVTDGFVDANYSRLGDGHHLKDAYLGSIHSPITAGAYSTEASTAGGSNILLGDFMAFKSSSVPLHYMSLGELGSAIAQGSTQKNLLFFYACSVAQGGSSVIAAFNVAPHGAVVSPLGWTGATAPIPISGPFPPMNIVPPGDVPPYAPSPRNGDYLYRHANVLIECFEQGDSLDKALNIANASFPVGAPSYPGFALSSMVIVDSNDERTLATLRWVYLERTRRESLPDQRWASWFYSFTNNGGTP
ncbi:MAG: hypothetical protein KF812_08495, partial [Fimbriimonadaceae bacterium]|nr:hypothetical protein [Fimbriimonadaceae bacterium]